MSNLNLELKAGLSEIIVREGKALDPIAPKVINLSGDINSIGNYLKIRREPITGKDEPLPVYFDGEGTQEVSGNRLVVEVDKTNRNIRLLLDPENPYGATVTGTLQDSEELKPFHINKNKEFTREELIKLIRFNRGLFTHPDKHAQLLEAYQKLNFKTSGNVKNETDDRGNVNLAFKKQVETSVPTELTLTAPIFKGQPSETFRVEICLDATDASIRFWFESVELHELTQLRIDEIFNQELTHAAGFVIINK